MNNKKFCAFRDLSYNFMDMKRPDLNLNCSEPLFPKLCGDNILRDKMYCIPKDSKCPVTNVKFEADGNLVVESDPNLGTPILEVWLSQGGPPCVDYFNNFNSMSDKTKFPIFSDKYNLGCPEVKIENDTYTTSKLFTEV